MISKAAARTIAKAYLAERKRDYIMLVDVDQVQFWPAKEVLYGKKEGQLLDLYSISYAVAWGLEEKSMFIHLDALTGEVLYTIGPTSWIEELEKE